MIQADCAFRRFEAARNRPSRVRRLHHLCQLWVYGAKTTKAISSVGSFTLRWTTSTSHTSTGLWRLPLYGAASSRQRATRPGRFSPGVGASPARHILRPSLRGPTRLRGPPTTSAAADHRHRRYRRSPMWRDTRLAGPLQHAPGQLWLRGKRAFLRNPCPGAALTVLRPLLGKIQFTVQQDWPRVRA